MPERHGSATRSSTFVASDGRVDHLVLVVADGDRAHRGAVALQHHDLGAVGALQVFCRVSAAAGGPNATWRRLRQRTRSNMRAPSTSWVDTSSVRPSARSSPNRRPIRSALAGSTPLSGSSSSSTRASCASARAISTRWRWPPDSSPKRTSALSASPTRSRASMAARRSAARAGSHQRPPARVPMSATSSALTGKSSRARSDCATYAGRPATSTSPARAGSSPVSARRRVVLPPPFGPSTQTDVPARRLRSRAPIARACAVADRQPSNAHDRLRSCGTRGQAGGAQMGRERAGAVGAGAEHGDHGAGWHVEPDARGRGRARPGRRRSPPTPRAGRGRSASAASPIAAGTASIEVTSSAPTAGSAAAATNATSASSARSIRATGRPRAGAPAGSKAAAVHARPNSTAAATASSAAAPANSEVATVEGHGRPEQQPVDRGSRTRTRRWPAPRPRRARPPARARWRRLRRRGRPCPRARSRPRSRGRLRGRRAGG